MMRRLALFSDIHGDIVALDAVIADISARGLLDDTYCLGDLVGYGPEPVRVIERIRSLGISTVLGNYDDGIGNRRGACGCYYATEAAAAEGAASYAFTDAAVGDEDAAWLARLPREIRIEVEGVRVILTHGSPRKINEYLQPDRTETLLARLADEAGADLVCVGHVHVPYHRTMTTADGHRVHYVSDGSVSKPKDGGTGAVWAEVVIGSAEEIAAAVQGDSNAGPAGTGEASVAVAFHRVTTAPRP